MACHHLWDTEQDIDDFSSGRSYSIMKSRYGRCLVASHLWLLGCNHQLTFIHIYIESFDVFVSRVGRVWRYGLNQKWKNIQFLGAKILRYPSGAKNWGLFMHGREISKHWPLAEFVVLRFWGCCKLFQSEEIWPSFNLHFQVQNMWSSGGGENIVHLISLDEAYLVQIGPGVAHHLL